VLGSEDNYTKATDAALPKKQPKTTIEDTAAPADPVETQEQEHQQQPQQQDQQQQDQQQQQQQPALPRGPLQREEGDVALPPDAVLRLEDYITTQVGVSARVCVCSLWKKFVSARM